MYWQAEDKHGFWYIGGHIVLTTPVYVFYPVTRLVYNPTIVSFVLLFLYVGSTQNETKTSMSG